MQYLALATDYDGTLATDGVIDPATLNALDRWRQSGRKVLLITGRRLELLLEVCPQSTLNYFDWIVVENGALLYDPQHQIEKPLGNLPPADFIERLQSQINQTDRREKLKELPTEEFNKILEGNTVGLLEVGRVIVATWQPYLSIVESTIQEFELDLQIILNKGAVMLLPPGVDKAYGMRIALEQLGLTTAQTVGVGDAENDLIFLEQCGYSAAVANALPAVKTQVAWVANRDRGAGVMELIDRIFSLDPS